MRPLLLISLYVVIACVAVACGRRGGDGGDGDGDSDADSDGDGDGDSDGPDLDPDANVAEMSVSDMTTLCEWAVARFGGEGTLEACDDDQVAYSVNDTDSCVLATDASCSSRGNFPVSRVVACFDAIVTTRQCCPEVCREGDGVFDCILPLSGDLPACF